VKRWSARVLLLAALAAAAGASAQEPAAPPPDQPPTEEPVKREEEVTVTAGHADRRIQDVPLRVEVVDREDIEEKALMTPGSVAMLLGETTGLRVQTTAPSTAAANVRVQGLRGRYTLLLSDGLPLHGVDGGSLSLLQVPPLDLGQVEIVKGAASALYGPSALGGVINLVSQAPDERRREALVNASTQTAADATLWLVEPARGSVAGSLLAGFHGQTRRDVDDDDWVDLPGFARGVVRPRATWTGAGGRSVFGTAGFMAEDRRGGTEPGSLAPDGLAFPQELDSRQADGGLVGRFPLGRSRLLTVRGSFTWRSERRLFGDALERGRRITGFGETVLGGEDGDHSWLLGAAVQLDDYEARDLPRFDYAHTTAGLFAQDEVRLGSKAAVGLSARVDNHSEYGTFASPRLSLLLRPATGLTARLSAGTGFFAPVPFLEETDETGLSRLDALSGLRAERARSAAVDVGWKRGPLELNATAFASRVIDPVQRRQTGPERFAAANVGRPADAWGAEALARFRAGDLLLLLTHSYTRATEEDKERPGSERETPLTPRNVSSFNAIWEGENWSVGLEAYFVGSQPLEDNPYRTEGRRHLLVGALVQRHFGRVHAFLNLENVGNVRQTRWNPLLLPARADDGRWTVDAWAPLDGFVANGGVRVSF
jgi:iron complex outermembrane receptor protein